MDITLNFSEGTDYEALLERVDFTNLSSPLSVDMGRVLFVQPSALSLLYGIFKLHSILYSEQKRKCIPANLKSEDTDVNRYMQRVNFFKCCPEFEKFAAESFRRHNPSGRFVPITEIHMSRNGTLAAKITSDKEAIELALQPYVSGAAFKGKPNIQEQIQGYHNEGLGLSVCKELMRRSGGFLQVLSGKAGVKVTKNGISNIQIAGWPGTMIVFRLNCQELTSINDIIKEFDKLKPKRDNFPAGYKGLEFA